MSIQHPLRGRHQNRGIAAALMCGTALAGLGATASYAQAPASGAIEQVVVTGTSIRGAAPVGANIISIDRAAIEATGAQNIQQLLASTPQITGFNNGGVQGNQGGFVGTGEELPTIHSLGASSSQSTLILVDGHNITPSSADGYSDPTIIPNVALQRVDVLPDGDSAVYGSSAIAGVINFVTRKDFSGLQTSAQYGTAHQYQTFTFGQLAGTTWDTGSVWGAYEYDSNSRFMAGSRSFSASVDYRSRGGTDFATFNCPVAAISPSNATTANVYEYPNYGAAPIANASQSQTAGNCDATSQNSLIPSSTKNAVFVRFRQDIGNRLHLGFDADYASRVNALYAPRGTIGATAFGPTGSSGAEGTAARNPFYVGNTETGTASEFVRWDPTTLLGPQVTKNGAHDTFGNLTIGVDLFSDWELNVNAFAGWDNSYTHANASFCATCAELALNGTTNTTGGAGASLADYFGLGTVNTSVRPLTTSNALDVWNPAATNRTSQTVLNELIGDQANNDVNTNLQDIRARFDGSLFELPAGNVKASWGGEWYQYHDNIFNTGSASDGPTQSSAKLNSGLLSRTIYSAFAELLFPVISPDMNIPLIQKFDLNAAGRYDWYKDTGGPQPGSTKNPRLGFTWVVDDALRVRGNYGTSFTAPNLDFESPLIGTTASQAGAQAFTIPTAQINYPGSFCTAIVGPCNVTTAMLGVTLAGGNPGLKPEIGLTYSLGLDINPGKWFDFLTGWSNNVTYWQAKFIGGMTTPTLQQGLTVQGLEQVLILAPPGGWTPTSPGFLNAVKGFIQTSALPPTIWYVTNFTRINAFTLQANGLDYTSQYSFSTADYGDFTVGAAGASKLRFDLRGGNASSTAPYTSFLNGHTNTGVLRAAGFNIRFNLDWTMDPFNVSLFTNFTNPYWFQNTNPPFNTLGLTPACCSSGTYEKIKSLTTFDLNAGYVLPESWLDGWTKGTRLTLTINNLLDTNPPFEDTADTGFNGNLPGYDVYNGSPLGRLITVGLKKTF